MALIADRKKEEQGMPGSTSGGSAFIGAGGSPTASSAPTSSGSGYTNLSKYLDVNDGAGIGQAIDSKLASDTESFKTPGESLKTTATNEINKGTKVDSNNVAGQLKTAPVGVAQSDYSNLTSGYGGPSKLANVTGYGGFNTAFTSAQTNADSYKDSKVQGNLVADSAKKDLQQGLTYNMGMRNLDSLFLQDQQPKIQQSIDKSIQGNTDYRKGMDTHFDTGRDAAVTTSNNTAQTVGTARTDSRAALLAGAQNQAASKTSALNKSNVGTSGASLGDALDPDSLASLEALSDLGGEGYSDDWYRKTYSEGTAAAPVVYAPSAPAPVLAQDSLVGTGRKNRY